MTNKDTTTIKVSKDTAEKLARLGKMGDTYEDVIVRLLATSKDAQTARK